MLEIDTPGHTDAIYHSYPDYIACHEKAPWYSYANGASNLVLAPLFSTANLNFIHRTPCWTTALYRSACD
jgi:hypothetical protein